MKPDYTGKRDPFYRLWHRLLGKEYWMMDIDTVESRPGKGIVAFIETSLANGKTVEEQLAMLNSKWKYHTLQVLGELSEKHRKPGFFVYYEIEPKRLEALKQVSYEIQVGMERFDEKALKSMGLDTAIVEFYVFQIIDRKARFLKAMSPNEYGNFLRSLGLAETTKKEQQT